MWSDLFSVRYALKAYMEGELEGARLEVAVQ